MTDDSIIVPCFKCGEALNSAMPDSDNIPYKGTAFQTHGHYGSTVFDPMDGTYLELNICDECLTAAPERVLMGQDHRLIYEDGAITDSERIPYQERPPLRIWDRA